MTLSSRQAMQSLQNRQFWTEFFLLYESLPALWKMRSPLYKERSAKIEAYDLMVDKLREIEPNADREDVLRKINIFRTNYRRECSRISMSHVLGKWYKTTLWYFDLLSFLRGQETRKEKKPTVGEKSIMRKKRALMVSPTTMGCYTPAARKSYLIEVPQMIEEETYDYDDDTQYEYITDTRGVVLEQMQCEDSEDTDRPLSQQQFQNEFQTFSLQHFMDPKVETETVENEVLVTDNEEGFADTAHEDNVTVEHNEVAEQDHWIPHTPTSDGARSPSIPTTECHSIKLTPPRKLYRNVKTMTMKQPQMLPPKCATTASGKTSEAAEILAKSWAIQYDEMSAEQKIYARKAIADILFEGCMGNLGRAGGGGNDDGLTVLPETSLPDREEVEKSSYVYEDGTVVNIQDWMVKMK